MATAKDAQVLFEEQVPRALLRFPEEAKAVDAVYLFRITGEGGGEWTVSLVDDPSVSKGDNGTAQCTVEVSHDDFKLMLSDAQAGMQLYFQDRLKVTGDPILATKLQQFFDLAGKDPGPANVPAGAKPAPTLS